MIKKILAALLLCLIGLRSYGDAKPKYDFVKGDNRLSLNAQRTTRVLQKHFPNEIDRENVINTILGFVRERPTSKTSGWIDVDQIETLCTNGGYDLTKSEDQKKCINFVRAFVALTLDDYYEVCGKDAHAKGITAHCIDNVFYHENTIEDTQVTMLEAVGLAKEYVRINANKYNNDVIECSAEYRNDGALIAPDYFIKCRSVTEPIYYEFKFDDVEEHKDEVADESLEATICSLHGEEYIRQKTIHAAYAGNGQKIRDYEYVPARCNTADSSKCKLINVTANKFARKTTFKNGACFIEARDSLDINNLRTAFGIDNKHFRIGIQIMSSVNMEETLCEYIKNAANTTITDCFCDSSKQRVYDFSGRITEADDVYTCFANNAPIDFLFDDLNESNKTLQQGGLQGMDCMAAGGTYAGQQCMYLDEKQCELLAKANLKNCPNCKKVEYKNGVCQLPSGADAIQVQKNQRIALIVGGAVVGVVVTVATAGTAGSPVSAVVFTLVETAGAVMEYNAQVKIDGIADEFLLTSQECTSADCAEELVKQNLQRLSNVANDMQAVERNAVDIELARLVELLPDDSQLFIDILGGESLTEANHKPLFDADSWEPEQVWRAVGVTLQMTSVLVAVGRWVLTNAGLLSKTLPKATSQITKKAKSSRVKLEEAINEGQEVKTSNGKKLSIQLFKRSANIAETEAKISKLFDDLFGQKITEISRLRSQQARIDEDFIARNKGMLFHASATDYKDGTVQALSRSWQVHSTPDAKGLLFADADFYSVTSYAKKGKSSASVQDYSNTHIRVRIPKQFADKFKDITNNSVLILSDRPRPYGYVYAVKPDGFRPAGMDTYMMIDHDVERIDRIAMPLDTDVIFVREKAFTDHVDGRDILKPELKLFVSKMTTAALDIDEGKNVLKNLQIYEECLEELAKMLK